MNCRQVRELIHPHLDGELAADAWADVQSHLDGCEGCARRARFESDFDQTLRRHLAVRPAPPEVVEGVRRRLEREFPRRRAWARLALHPAAGYAVAALLLLALVLPLASGLLPGAGTTTGASSVSVEGHVVCVECERAGRSAEEQRGCRIFTHRAGLRTADGQVWTLANLGAGARLASRPELRGSPVRFEGRFYPPIQTVDVAQFEVLPGAS